MEAILGNSEKERIREVLTRMTNGEISLHTKTVGPITMVRKSTLPILLEELVNHDIARGVLKCVKVIRRNNHEVRIYEQQTYRRR